MVTERQSTTRGEGEGEGEGRGERFILSLRELSGALGDPWHPPTVKNHVTAILKALKVSNCTEAVIAVANRVGNCEHSANPMCTRESPPRTQRRRSGSVIRHVRNAPESDGWPSKRRPSRWARSRLTHCTKASGNSSYGSMRIHWRLRCTNVTLRMVKQIALTESCPKTATYEFAAQQKWQPDAVAGTEIS